MRILTNRHLGALLVLLPGLVGPAHAALDVFTCEPEWASLTTELGGEHVKVYSATTPYQDPHYIQARPSLIAKVRRADMVICTGAELETGWLPVLLRKSGNSNVQPGNDGLLFAADVVELGGQPNSLDRSQGHQHAAGNPHIHAGPQNMLPVAQAIAARLALLDADNAETYESRLDDFSRRWQQAMSDWEQTREQLAGKKVIAHHQYWFYLVGWSGMDKIAYLEPKPGVQPTVSHLSKLLQKHGGEAELIVRVNYSNPRAAKWLADKTGLPVVELPSTVDFKGGQTLFEWFDTLLGKLVAQ